MSANGNPAYTLIDLSGLPAPEILETLDYEVILSAIKTAIAARDASLAPVLDLESEPLTIAAEAFAYRELLLRQRYNDVVRALLLAFSGGGNLDHLGAWPYGIARRVIDPGDPEAIPPIEPTHESDDAYRARIQLSPEGYSVAGPVGAYYFHSLNASILVKDASVDAPRFSLSNHPDIPAGVQGLICDYDAHLADPIPGDVAVTILSTDGDGTPNQALLDLVQAALNSEDVRPLTDRPRVRAAEILKYTVTAVLWVNPGPDAEVVRAAAESAAQQYADENHKLGRDIAESGFHRALHQPGVSRVEMTLDGNIIVEPRQAAYCTALTVTIGGTSE